ncbi:glycine oxidase ThiO [Thalassotalea psychrophila]|uniref:Glycine oxidase ThiO n=1 Tax=Thalassotalea psychrophila TaxID=3065647 RepID=A0ABY9TPG2_9GAMM|nr:glycine oxidase ThiO [Colwelliaceae bacterium SQ149]
MSSKHIAIIGAGLLGRLTALTLTEQGYQVTLLDKDNKLGQQSAAYAAAGLLTPLGEAMHSDASIVEMGFESLQLWPKLLAKLDGYTYFQQTGSIIVSHEQDIGDYQRFARFLQTHYPQHPLQTLNRQQLLQLEPELGRSFKQGIYLPEEGQIGNRKLLVALQQQLEKLNVSWIEHADVTSISDESTICTLGYKSADKHQTLDCNLIIDCRGSGARLNTSHNDAFPLQDLRGVRGELFQLFAPEVKLQRPIRLMHPRYQLYIAPKTKGFYVVGATEIESDDCSAMTVRSSLELLSAAYSVHPGFAEANIRQHVTQLRPAFSDNKPQISVSKRLIQVNGLYRHGFLIAPVVLEQVMQAVAQRYDTKHNTAQSCKFQQLLPIRSDNEIIH